MHDDAALVSERLERVRRTVTPHIWQELGALEVTAWPVPGEPVDFATARAADYSPMAVGTWWGRAWSTLWLHVTGELPAGCPPDGLEVNIDLGFSGDWAGNQAEGMVFTADGHPLKAVNPMNQTVPLPTDARRVDLWVEAAANPNLSHKIGHVTPQGDPLTVTDELLYRFAGAKLVRRRDEVFALSMDLEVAHELMLQLPAESTRRARLLRCLEDAADELDHGDVVGSAAAMREVLAPALAARANASAQRMMAVGHAHIDSAWLWPVRETRRKTVRTFSNVLALAREYPDFRFACTTPQQYQWVREQSPEVFDAILEAIDRGQWHPVGGMWVESDANLPGGEALVRQFTSGLRWMTENLGVRPRCLWLPDSFGYTAALPQIAALAGMRWFFTQKLSWNRTNVLPHHTFWWEGMDGTRIWTHFPPVDCYDSVANPEEVKKAEANFKEKGRATWSLLPFGYGDGGGGPTREMMERIHRMADLEDAPRLVPGSPDDFFDQAREDYPNPPVWSGELYLEFHRGTYTSQAAMKRGNRRSEALLAEAELLATQAALHPSAEPTHAPSAEPVHLPSAEPVHIPSAEPTHTPSAEPVEAPFSYPHEELEELWRQVLLLQFHDILPGSSIAWVHREAREDYARIADALAGLRARALADGPGEAACVVNGSLMGRREVILDGQTPVLVEVPAGCATGRETAEVRASRPVTLAREGEEFVLDNELVRVIVDGDGLLTSVRDVVADREVLLSGRRGNLLQLHPDLPCSFDAWELEDHYRHRVTDLTTADAVTVVREEPLLVQLRVERHVGDSTITQTLALAADTGCLDIETTVDWRERERILKLAFPLAVHARESVAEVQFGHVRRPVHANTSWDQARFEVWAHRWMLVDDGAYGVALANDCSYGHDVCAAAGADAVRGVVLRSSLLRAPSSPDPQCDLGVHTMRHSLVVGADLAAAHAAGVRLNTPLRLESGQPTAPLVSADFPFVVDAVKQAFDGSGDLVVRLHEASGSRSRGRLLLGVDAAGVVETDLLEEPCEEPTQALPADALRVGRAVDLELHPFQILTLRLVSPRRAARSTTSTPELT